MFTALGVHGLGSLCCQELSLPAWPAERLRGHSEPPISRGRRFRRRRFRSRHSAPKHSTLRPGSERGRGGKADARPKASRPAQRLLRRCKPPVVGCPGLAKGCEGIEKLGDAASLRPREETRQLFRRDGGRLLGKGGAHRLHLLR